MKTDYLPPTTYRFSRRAFLSLASGAAATMLPGKSAGEPLGQVVLSRREEPDCVLLDVQERGTLPESLAGYQLALEAGGARFFRTSSAGPLPHSKTIIVPACMALLPAMTREIAAALKGGSRVVLESGAVFATPPDFARHQEWLRSYWNVRVEAPVDLWRAGNDQRRDPQSDLPLSKHSPRASRAPYVDFHWPFSTKVRDFSRVLPVFAPEEHVVASCGHISVASKHTKGKGTLLFLGSPVGPALLAGDAEASRWLRAIITMPG